MADINQEYLGKKTKHRRYYTPYDISLHFSSLDLWVIIFGQVYELTTLIQSHIESPLTQPLIDFGGKDISHFFNPKTKEPLTRINTNTGKRVFYCPHGRYLHIPNPDPSSQKEPVPANGKPWWRDSSYIVGKVTQKVRKLRIINMLTHQEDIIDVPCEETIEEIQERYLLVNEHAASYTWKSVTNKPLDMEGTLDENEIFDETEKFEELGIPENEWYIPPILIYFDDDLTQA